MLVIVIFVYLEWMGFIYLLLVLKLVQFVEYKGIDSFFLKSIFIYNFNIEIQLMINLLLMGKMLGYLQLYIMYV